MKTTSLLLLTSFLLFSNCKKATPINLEEVVPAKDNKDRAALEKTALLYSIKEMLRAKSSEDPKYPEFLKQAEEKAKSSLGKEIQIRSLEGNFAIVSLWENQLDIENSNPVDKLFFFNKSTWEPISVPGKFLTMQFRDINKDVQKDLVAEGGCCSNKFLSLIILDPIMKPNVYDETHSRQFTISEKGEFVWEGKGACEEFLLEVKNLDPYSEELVPTESVRYDCIENKFL